MSIAEKFRNLKKHGEGALIAYVTGGDPSPKHTPMIVEALVKGGADIVEIGIPFSDPIADGPVIQASDMRALTAGTTPRTVFNIVKEVRRVVDVPIVLLTYYNILFKMGVENFLDNTGKHGADGVIVADLPVEEAGEYREAAEKHGVDIIFLATPSTSLKRLNKIINMTSGFLYLVSVFGVTGMREKVEQLTIRTIENIHPYTVNTIPLAVGFGLSNPKHVKSIVACGAEGVIVGSAFVKLIEKNTGDTSRLVEELTGFAREMKLATMVRSNRFQNSSNP